MVDHILIDVKEAHALEKRTVLQGECAEWLKQYKYGLTASNFGKVYTRVQRPSESMLKSIFVPKDLSNVRAISHGKGKEKVARTIYAKKMQQSVPEFAIFDAGISVHPSLPYLGASLDGKVFDPSTENKYGLLEIKCPFSKRGDTSRTGRIRPQLLYRKTWRNLLSKERPFLLCASTRAVGYYRVIVVWFLCIFVRLQWNVCWQDSIWSQLLGKSATAQIKTVLHEPCPEVHHWRGKEIGWLFGCFKEQWSVSPCNKFSNIILLLLL